MATPADRFNDEGGLPITFDYDPTTYTPVVGDRVEIIVGRKVQAVSATASATSIGEVIAVRNALNEVTVMTRYLHNRQDRILGEVVVPGPFVFGVGNKVFQFVSGTHNPAAIAGMVLVGGALNAVGETLEW